MGLESHHLAALLPGIGKMRTCRDRVGGSLASGSLLLPLPTWANSSMWAPWGLLRGTHVPHFILAHGSV